MSFAGKVAVVTGAAKGIGRATAEALAREGCAGVALLDVDDAAAEVAEALGPKRVTRFSSERVLNDIHRRDAETRRISGAIVTSVQICL